jgi:hypothetical protein
MRAQVMLTTLLFAQVSAISQITFCMVTSERPVSYLERDSREVYSTQLYRALVQVMTSAAVITTA